MHIISRKALKDFWEKHTDSELPLKTWFRIIKGSKYASFNHLKATFSTADKVGDKIVFNIGGNKYRLVAVIHFNYGRVYVRHVLTHQEYDKGGWKNG
ncbi:MAG: type II toxin-antitoxin system HigB family toxin [Candidatus Omnitrophica bacterium]|nr:type II toxin-antitoxin system HigB family toxin [Candidatus Omnitrophota bacterium]